MAGFLQDLALKYDDFVRGSSHILPTRFYDGPWGSLRASDEESLSRGPNVKNIEVLSKISQSCAQILLHGKPSSSFCVILPAVRQADQRR